jgi:glycosyltransferase involved in cell wall biosynthesis
VDRTISSRARYLVGYVGTIGPQDGLDYWMRSLAELVHTLERRDVLAIVIGNGDALEGIRDLAAALDLEDHVWFTGRLPESEVRRYLSAVHVCVQPDPLSPLNDKSTMNKLMEYMALGKPTVAFDLRETRRSAGEAASYATPNDVVDFAHHVSRLLDDPKECCRLGQIGRRRVQDSLAWEYSAEALQRAYAAVLAPVRPERKR